MNYKLSEDETLVVDPEIEELFNMNKMLLKTPSTLTEIKEITIPEEIKTRLELSIYLDKQGLEPIKGSDGIRYCQQIKTKEQKIYMTLGSLKGHKEGLKTLLIFHEKNKLFLSLYSADFDTEINRETIVLAKTKKLKFPYTVN
jgi:hypothetical protein